MRPFIAGGLALVTVLDALLLIRTNDTASEPIPRAPRILEVEVLDAESVVLSSAKSAQGIKTYIVADDTAELRAQVEGVESIEAVVSMNARTNLGRSAGSFLDDALVAIEVALPRVGSQWQIPGPGADGQTQTLTIDGDEDFIIQLTGTGGRNASGEPTVVGASVRVIREQ